MWTINVNKVAHYDGPGLIEQVDVEIFEIGRAVFNTAALPVHFHLVQTVLDLVGLAKTGRARREHFDKGKSLSCASRAALLAGTHGHA